jgi:hypothetical protein
VLICVDRSDWPTAAHLLETLKPNNSPSTPPLDPELSFIQHDTYIDYLISTAQFSLAYQCISSLAQSLKEDNADVQQRISVLLMQADLWIKVGKPERGFSVALRAASVSFRARLGFTLWHAVGCLGAILNSLGECQEARRLMEGVLPQVRDDIACFYYKMRVVYADVSQYRLWKVETVCSLEPCTRTYRIHTWVLLTPTLHQPLLLSL